MFDLERAEKEYRYAMIKEGHVEKLIEIAKRLIEEGIEIKLIAKVTGLKEMCLINGRSTMARLLKDEGMESAFIAKITGLGEEEISAL